MLLALKMSRALRSSILAIALLTMVPLFAQKAKEVASPLDQLRFSLPETQLTTQEVGQAEMRATAPAEALAAYDAFLTNEGGSWQVTFDRVTGRPAIIEGSGIPWIPGSGNSLSAESLGLPAGTPGSGVPVKVVAERALNFMAQNTDLLGADPKDLVLMQTASGPILDYLYYVDFGWTYHGIPVEKAHVVFRLNHGNLVQFGQEYTSAAIQTLDPRPYVSRESAWQILWGYVGGYERGDRVEEKGRLIVMPVSTPSALAGAAVAPGGGLAYRLVYVLSFRRPGIMGTWEARIDAHTGEVVSFNDANWYGSIHGGIYAADQPSSEVNRAFPFADTGSGYADQGGKFAGSAATSQLNGQYVRISDACGPISLGTSNGDLDFGSSSGTDCVTPGFGGAGNTHAARTQYYNVNLIQIKARTYLPGVTWLSNQLTDNVNLNQTCNAYWDGSAVNFFKSGGGCANTGELPGVSMHEWGHGLDQNDGNGSSPDKGTGETYGDFTAALQTHQSCVGGGFLGGNCGGYGNPCLACTGVRDIDYAQHVLNTPATPANFIATHCPDPSPSNPNYKGPCQKEGHCESYVSSEALWDLATRDFVTWGLDPATAWQLVDRLWYTTRPTATGAFSCSGSPSYTSDGCTTGSLFKVFRVADDCDGNLANGTPHASAIFAAFDRHAIACAADVNTDQVGCCPTLAAPTVTATPGSNTVALSWGSVTNAATYTVFRNESGCDAGYTKIGSTTAPTTSFTDVLAVNGMTYYYRVQAVGSTQSCTGAMSACATAFLPLPPSLQYQSNAFADVCAVGGLGNGDGVADAGETLTLTVTVHNPGGSPVTGITSTLSTSTSGVGVTSASSPYPSVAGGGDGSNSTPFTVTLSQAVPCGTVIQFNLHLVTDQGTFDTTFTITAGVVTPGVGTLINEAFESWPPPGWTVTPSSGGRWLSSTANVGCSSYPYTNDTGGTGLYADANSDCYGSGMDTTLTTPAFSLADPTYTGAQLEFKTDFEDYANRDDGYVDITTNGTTWTNLIHYAKADFPGPRTETVDLTPYLGNASVKIRFHYVAPLWDWYWQVDDVMVSYTRADTCAMHACITCQGPVITLQPQDQTVVSGSTATLTVNATGTPTLNYQWYEGTSGDTSNLIGGAIQPSYTTPPVTTTKTYWVRVGNSCGQAYSRTVTVSPCTPPAVTVEPLDQSITSGQTASLSVSASGSATLTYQWYEGSSGDTSNPVGGALLASYTTPPLTTTTTYWVRVTNGCGQADSRTATVNVCTPPSITGEPLDQSITNGETATLSVAASGSATLNYQWYEGTSGDTSSPVGGATLASYTTPPLTSSTTYWVRVTNGCGHADSRTATVTVTAGCVAPTITTEPADQSITSGNTAILAVVATGTATLDYQWYEGTSGDTTSPIGGALLASYTTPPLTTTTTYWVRVTNGCGHADSRTATVNVCTPPTITTEPADQSITSGNTATLSVAASGSATLNYQWYEGTSGDTSNPMGGAILASFTTPILTATTTYWVRVSNGCGHADSRTATVNVCTPPTLTTEPADQSIASGSSATLNVSASGSATLSYQWYQGQSGNTSDLIPGAIQPTYTTPALTSTAFYWVRVTNGCGHADSRTATITVIACTPPAITSEPLDQGVASGTSATLSVLATGSATLNYQWYLGASGNTASPVGGATNPTFSTPPVTGMTSYWVRVGNDCGHADSRTVTVSVEPPPVISSMRKLGSPFRIKVLGSNLQSGIRVFINGSEWTNIKWKNTGKITLKGGSSLKALVPKNTPTQFRFLNPDGGETTLTWQWP